MPHNLAESVINSIWPQLGSIPEGVLRTPDNINGVHFIIRDVNAGAIAILTGTQNRQTAPDKAPVNITKAAFIAALDYLISHNHVDSTKRCEINARNSPDNAGDLCRASRAQNHNVRCINYILPILQYVSLVEIDGNRLNTTWLI